MSGALHQTVWAEHCTLCHENSIFLILGRHFFLHQGPSANTASFPVKGTVIDQSDHRFHPTEAKPTFHSVGPQDDS